MFGTDWEKAWTRLLGMCLHDRRALITNPSDRKPINGGTPQNVGVVTDETPEMAALFI
jgi:hypothetical protein